ncbi:MAG: hypothetical protein M3Y27_01495 [Acidobacteriota bacterium]|nr:hypothetical protein [Acidobacteriota bacterium]
MPKPNNFIEAAQRNITCIEIVGQPSMVIQPPRTGRKLSMKKCKEMRKRLELK